VVSDAGLNSSGTDSRYKLALRIFYFNLSVGVCPGNLHRKNLPPGKTKRHGKRTEHPEAEHKKVHDAAAQNLEIVREDTY
jgi:hypothetical protein